MAVAAGSNTDGLNSYEVIADARGEEPLVTHARHRVHLESASRFLEAFLGTRQSQPSQFDCRRSL
jgi:hypothetical protein